MNTLLRIRTLAIPLLAGLAMTSCLMVSEPVVMAKGAPGFVKLELALERNQNMLLKSAAADTTFALDSLIVVLTAQGVDTVITDVYPISGRADTGSIVLSPRIYALTGLHNWKAKFYSIDMVTTPAPRRDTVHMDSVIFGIYPADTVVVEKAINPRYAILRARVRSTSEDSILNNVVYVRLRVDGTVRDSVAVGGTDATLRWLQAMSGTTLHASGDSGRILRSTNDGTTWTEQKFGTEPMVAGHFPTSSSGYVVSASGQVRATENAGVSWTSRAATAGAANAVFFTSASTGFVVGQGGGIYKTGNNGNSWYTNMISNTTQHLNGVSFPTTSVGYVVGDNETILKTTTGTAGDSPPPGGVIWLPVAGGWFTQTSNTASSINDVHFTSTSQGWVVGDGDYYRRTTDGGATWLERGGINVTNAKAIDFTSSSTAYAVGDGGTMSQFQSEWYWAPRTSGTTKNLRDVRFTGVDTGYIVGNDGTLRRTINGSTNSWPYVTWTSQTSPGGAGNDLYSVYPVTSKIVFVAGEGGTIGKTTNAGTSWALQTTPTTNILRGIHFTTASNGIAVGNSGIILRTTNGGSNWSTVTSGTSDDLLSIQFVTATSGYVTGENGITLKTDDGGVTWHTQDTPNGQDLKRVFFFNEDYGWAVGAGGTILKAVNKGDNWTGGGYKRDLKGVFFVNDTTGWVIGEHEVILKTTNGGDYWFQQHLDTAGGTLHGISFVSSTTGWVSGDDGLVMKTTNGGTTWNEQDPGVGVSLQWAFFRNTSQGFLIGGTESLLKTTNGGTGWSSSFVGAPGAKTFARTLTHKYLTPNANHTILLEAMDRLSTPLRGYQASLTLNLAPSQDSVLDVQLTKCGYVDSIPCIAAP